MPLTSNAKLKAAFLALLFQLIQALKLSNYHLPVSLVPNLPNKLSPPIIIETDSEAEKNFTYYLKIECSEKTKNFFKFSPIANFCYFQGLKGSAKEINDILKPMRISLSNIENQNLGQIKYYLIKENSNENPLTFVQDFKLEGQINVEIFKSTIEVLPETSDEFDETILNIDKRFSSELADLEIQLSKDQGEIPDWLGFKILGRSLVAFGNPPANFGKDLSLSFYLRDKKSGLASDKVSLSLTISRIYQLDRFFLAFAVFFLFFCICIGAGIVYFFVQSRPSSELVMERIGELSQECRSLRTVFESSKEIKEEKSLGKISTRTSLQKENAHQKKIDRKNFSSNCQGKTELSSESSLDRILKGKAGEKSGYEYEEIVIETNIFMRSEGSETP